MRAWVPFSTVLAPVALVGGWTLGATRQRGSFDATTETISALAAHGADARWVMTTGLVLVGAAHVATALGLEESRPAGRVVLGAGGVATLLVAVFAQPSAGHVPTATVSFAALAVWPALSDLPTRRAGVLVSGGLLALVGWLVVEMGRGDLLGLSERVAAGAQAVWPAAAVAALWLRARRLRHA